MNSFVGSTVIGQSSLVENLNFELENFNLANAYLFCGPTGSGRSILAKDFAGGILCENKNFCQVCESCKAFLNNTHPDFLNLKPIGNIIKVDDVHEIIREAKITPRLSNSRVVLIEDADRMNIQSANALLKNLEEPEDTTIFLLCAPSTLDLLPTIVSRCRVKTLKTPTNEAIFKFLKEDPELKGFEDLRIKAAINLAKGHVGVAKILVLDNDFFDSKNKVTSLALKIRRVSDALAGTKELINSNKKQAEVQAEKRYLLEIEKLNQTFGLKENERKDPKIARYYKNVEEIKKLEVSKIQKDRLTDIIIDVLMTYRDVAYLQNGGNEEYVINVYFINELKKVANSLTKTEVSLRISKIDEALKTSKTNTSPQLLLEALFSSLLIPERAINR